jgi:DNA-binding beta-propeller fold protein YncE
VTVIDGANNSIVTNVPAGTAPYAIAANPVTNLIYVGQQRQQERYSHQRGQQLHQHRFGGNESLGGGG